MTQTAKPEPPSKYPELKKFRTCSENWRELSAIVRKARRRERERREDSAWRKRCAALMSGRFAIPGDYSDLGLLRTDDEALDAYAPHPTDSLRSRVFTREMEAAECKAWSRVEAVEHAAWPSMADYRHAHIEACNAYLRAVDAMEKAANGIRRLALSGLRKPALHSLKLQGRRAA